MKIFIASYSWFGGRGAWYNKEVLVIAKDAKSARTLLTTSSDLRTEAPALGTKEEDWIVEEVDSEKEQAITISEQGN
jgi:hypothetical protein